MTVSDVWHVGPTKPATQVHVSTPFRRVHVPPWEQVTDKHSSPTAKKDKYMSSRRLKGLVVADPVNSQ